MVQVTPSRQLTDTEKLRKVITELIETERTYVKVILSPDLDLDLSLTLLSAVNTFTLCCVNKMCYIAAFELPNEDLFGAIKEGNISLKHRDKRSVRKHSGNLWIPTAVPSNPGECS